MKSIDINSDLGEFQNTQELNKELKILKYISSCSIACGGHTGDTTTIREILKACKRNGVAVGPHPSYPDKKGFGRKKFGISKKKLSESIKEQISLFIDVADSLSMSVSHVKLHGRLYSDASRDKELSLLLIDVIKSFKLNLAIIGPTKSSLEKECKSNRLLFLPEAFIDRVYKSNLTLVDRDKEVSVLNSIEEQVNQAEMIVCKRQVLTENKKVVNLSAKTLCIHGDSPNSLEAVKAVRTMLNLKKVIVKPN